MLKRQEAREGASFGRVYYQVNALNDRGQVTGYNKGQELMTVSYDDAGHVAGISTGTDYIQADTYSFDGMGNLTSRHLTALQQQTFAYDNLNRVTTVDGQVVYSYADNGNLERKDDWEQRYNETANSPIHGITSRSKGTMTETFGYDKNGNQTWAKKNGTNWRTVTYSGRNKATEISINGKKAFFKYDANNRRYKRVDTEQTIYYVGTLELTVNHTVNDQYIKRYIGNDAMQTYYAAGNASIKWLFTDHQGSITAITDGSFKLLKRFAYDVFGQQSEIAPTALEAQLYYAQQSNLSAFNAIASNTRGYTGHEQVMLDGDNRVIHMNGRIYDAGTGRMMQADPVVQAPSNLQNYNAYSYVLNNPLSRIDPSGYISLNPFKKITRGLIKGATKIFGPEFVNLVGSVVSTYFGGPWGAAAWSYEFTRAMGGSSSQAFRAGAIAGITAAAFQQVGEHFKAEFGITAESGVTFSDLGVGQQLQWAGTHAMVGGISSVASGGKFGHGFISAGFTKLAMGNAGFNMNNRKWSAIAGRTTVAAVIGGTASTLTGGKFANGAKTAAMMHLLNAEGRKVNYSKIWKDMKQTWSDYWKSDSYESGVYALGYEGTFVLGSIGGKLGFGIYYDSVNAEFNFHEKIGINFDPFSLEDSYGYEVSTGFTFDYAKSIENFLGPSADYGGTAGPIGIDLSTKTISSASPLTYGFDLGFGGGVSRVKVETRALLE